MRVLSSAILNAKSGAFRFSGMLADAGARGGDDIQPPGAPLGSTVLLETNRGSSPVIRLVAAEFALTTSSRTL
jgi:hypothetical protein